MAPTDMRIDALLVLSLSACLMPKYGSAPSSNAAGDPSTEPASSSSSSSSSSAMPASAAAPAPAGPVSVTIRSACSKTVKVFFGDKPKFGSGTYSSIDSNSVSSHSFRPGEQLWIVDESENGLGSAQVSASTHELEVSSSCTAISSR